MSCYLIETKSHWLQFQNIGSFIIIYYYRKLSHQQLKISMALQLTFKSPPKLDTFCSINQEIQRLR